MGSPRLRSLLWGLPLLVGAVDCYSTGSGTPPPIDQFYFPVGLAVSQGGNVLYVVNSDFDLQYNGGTIQSYDLFKIRNDALSLISSLEANPPSYPESLHYTRPAPQPGPNGEPACPGSPPVEKSDEASGRQPLGETCAPPVVPQDYFRSGGVIGAFATDILRSPPPTIQAGPNGAPRSFDRLFVPVRGDASLTWASVVRDDPNVPPSADPKAYAPFQVACGQGSDARCDESHKAGANPEEPGNTRNLTMPGEPFGVAFGENDQGFGTTLVVTHQTDTKVSLFDTGLAPDDVDRDPLSSPPSLQFVLDGLPQGGIGITAIPHDPDAFKDDPSALPHPAFLETNGQTAELDLLRYYDDQTGGVSVGGQNSGSSLLRPFLNRETSFPLLASASGTDSRGIAIDPTPRIACKAKVAPVGAGRTQAQVDADNEACARKPARIFVANRAPAALLVGDVGGTTPDGGTYDADRVDLHTSIPMNNGPSNVYLAPIVDKDGAYALRVFVVCFDSAEIFVYDPDALTLENIIRVGAGPFAMAFDPFDLTAVATHQQVPAGPDPALKRYRFAYVASFTDSYLELIDLDDSRAVPRTFESIVFTLGDIQTPKGS